MVASKNHGVSEAPREVAVVSFLLVGEDRRLRGREWVSPLLWHEMQRGGARFPSPSFLSPDIR